MASAIDEALSIFGEARDAKRVREEEEEEAEATGCVVAAEAAPSDAKRPKPGVVGLDEPATADERAAFDERAAASRCAAGAYEFAVRLRGLPWTATCGDVGGFLLGRAGVFADEQAVFVHNHGGDGFFRFKVAAQEAVALSRNRQRLKDRYVEVFPSTGAEADRWAKLGAKRRDGAYRGVVRVRGLPYRISGDDVKAFFERRGAADVAIVAAQDGRPSGEAFVVFESERQARNAVLTKHKEEVGGRWVEVVATCRGAAPASSFFKPEAPR